MKVIYLGVITAKNHFGHICAYVINTIILLVLWDHFSSGAFIWTLSYHLIGIKVEFGVLDSNKNQSLVQFVHEV